MFLHRLLVWGVLLLLLASGLAEPLRAGEATLPPFRMVVDDNHPPFSFTRADGQVDGLSVRLVSAVLTDIGTTVTIEAMPWRRIALMAKSTPNLVMASVMQLPERRDQFVWLGTLFREPIYLYALRERKVQIANAAQLNGLRIGTRRDSAGYRQLLRIGVPTSQIDMVDDPLQNLRKLQAGRLDVITLQPSVLAWHLRQFGVPPDSLESVFPLLPETAFQLAASVGTDPKLVEALRSRFAALEKSGRLDQLRSDASRDLLP